MLNRESQVFQCRTIYYNAWKHDDYEDALIPLVCNICKEFQESCKNDQHIMDITKKVLKFGFSALVRIGCAAIPGIGQFASVGKEITEIFGEKEACDIFNDYALRENAKNDFRNAITELVYDQEKLVIFIDELDRCRPTFAVETLEVIKHFFNIDKVVFVFALDIIQLSKSIEIIYGQGMDACGYLSRFFDIQVNLPVPTVKQYLNSIPKLTNLRSDIILGFLNCVAIEFSISAREIKILSRAMTYYIKSSHSFQHWEQGFCFFTFLLMMKYKRKEQFQDIITGKNPLAKDSNIVNTTLRDYYRIASHFAANSRRVLLDFGNKTTRFTDLEGTDKDLGAKLASHLVGDDNLKSNTDEILGRLLHMSIELIYPKKLIDSNNIKIDSEAI